jgi:hypothetical protein
VKDREISSLAIDRRSVILCAIWIGTALLLGGVSGLLTRSYRLELLADAANRILAGNGDSRRIESLESGGFAGSPAALGGWFAVNDPDERAFVFTITRNGNAAACIALTDRTGKVKTMVPLSGNAAQLTGELPLPVYRFYLNRIEKAAGRQP